VPSGSAPAFGRPGGERSGASRSLSQQAYDHVRSEIVRGRLPVGSVVTESGIAEQLGISKTPVRQALQLLRGEGLLEAGPRRQLVVRGFTEEHRREVADVREALEGLALRRACERMSIDDVDYLHLLLMRQRRAADGGREDDFIDLDEEFHLCIAAGAQLPVVERFLRQLRGFVRLMRLGTRRREGHLQLVLQEHTAIVDALEARDAERAVAALREHLRRSDY
jgi:GntR family transcriptional regulator, rspAB operon transcriptional repressor